MYHRVGTRRRTHISFLISLFLHLVGVLAVTISFPHWYRPLPVTEPIVADPIAVELHTRLFYSEGLTKVALPAKAQTQRDTARAPSTARATPKASVRPTNRENPPLRLKSRPLGVAAQLPPSPESPLSDTPEKGWAFSLESIGEPEETVIESPQSLQLEIKRGFSQKQTVQNQNEQTAANESPTFSRDEQISSAIEEIAGAVSGGAGSSVVDVVFLVDASGSMEDNIRAVGRHLVNMVNIFQERGLDFTLGVVKFKYSALVFPQTKDYREYERLLENMACGGDERAYDAIVKSISRVKFRPEARRRFILVTDEPLKGSYKIQEVLKRCRDAGITVDVIGVNRPLQKYLAAQTGGAWFPIPGS